MSLIACPGCDLLQHLPVLAPRDKVFCARCGHALVRRPFDSWNRCFALTLAAAICLLIANVTPLMGLTTVGRGASTTIIGGALALWNQGEQFTSAVVAFCALLAPAGYLLCMLAILLAARLTPVPRWTGELLRWTRYLQIWSLHEVMTLGVLVALVKIAEVAHVDPGIGIFAVGALTLLFPAIMAHFDPTEIWDRIEWAQQTAREAPRGGDGVGVRA